MASVRLPPRPPPTPLYVAERDAERIRRNLVHLVEDSDLGHRTIERRAELNHGYLTQILHARVELKLWHVLAVLRGLAITPERFFAAAYPRHRGAPGPGVAASSDEDPFPILGDRDLDLETARERVALLVIGIAEVESLRLRAARCEEALRDVGRSPEVAARLDVEHSG